jgi:serine/threonine protein phosphatase PrpC
MFDIDDNGIVLAVSDGMGGALAGKWPARWLSNQSAKK